ncbi:MAG TPA: LysR family transcriptional regulator [Ramlibacter sp.]|nr:LysR family transcriptional regulator [Ramlibacter sp.]
MSNSLRAMDNVRAITTFIRIVKAGNFSKAARDLGITPQAASIHVKQLEEWVGVRLFNRSTRNVSLTQEGASFYETCFSAVNAIEEGVEKLRHSTEEVFGTIRVAVPHGFGWRFVAPAIGRFLDLHPKVSVDLIVQNRIPDVVTDGIDVGILADPLPDTTLVARRVATSRFVHCASPIYLQRYGTPRTVDELARHRCINLRNWVDGEIIPWRFQREDSVVSHNVKARFITNDGDSALEALLSGAGIGQLASYRAAPYIRSQRLVPVLVGETSAEFHFYVYLQKRTQIPKKNRAFADFLCEELARHPDLRPL